MSYSRTNQMKKQQHRQYFAYWDAAILFLTSPYGLPDIALGTSLPPDPPGPSSLELL